MKKTKIFLFFFIVIVNFSFAQNTKTIEINKEYSNIKFDKAESLDYSLKLLKGSLYDVSVLQEGIDVKLILLDENNKQILDKDSPNGENGYEKFEYSPTETGIFHLKIVGVEEDGNPEKGEISVLISKISKAEIQRRVKIKKELEPENKKNVQTLDIDHFWKAFDNLKKCKTHQDSVNSFQTIYLDRATDGLKDFIVKRQFTAEKFVKVVSKAPKFYNSVRKNTYEVKNAVPLVEAIVAKFQEIYPNFKPKKVCFAIGLLNTGGTVSDNFLLIGTEVSAATKFNNFSEFNDSAYSKILAHGDDVTKKIKGIVAHEYVHTQQPFKTDKNAIKCDLLNQSLIEGAADFIGELTSGSIINGVAHKYGDQHEEEIWQNFKDQLCDRQTSNWLYNYATVKDKPADLGYYIGYKINEAYYQNAKDKTQAVIDIIEMNDPLRFLQLSKYDQKVKK